MDVVHHRCAGLDVSKRDAKCCVRIRSPRRARAKSTVTTWSSMTSQVLALRDHLVEEQVTLVVMEATSDYWKPFFYVLEDGPFEVMPVNARHTKNMPGRKTDVNDAQWLAQLGAHGLVRGSFGPPSCRAPKCRSRLSIPNWTHVAAATRADHAYWIGRSQARVALLDANRDGRSSFERRLSTHHRPQPTGIILPDPVGGTDRHQEARINFILGSSTHQIHETKKRTHNVNKEFS
jgi:hypothetical protein